MSILTHLFIYLRAVFLEGIGIVFTLFDILGIIVFLNPSIAAELSLEPNHTRLVAAVVFQVSFLLGNLRVHRRLTIELTTLKSQPKPSIKAAIERVAGVEETYANQPLDRWAAKIRIANTGMDPPSIHSVISELVFRKPFGDFSLRAIITSLIYRRLDSRPSFLIRIPVYMEGLAIIGSPPASVKSAFSQSDRERHPLSGAKEVFVADWETKQPIGVRPHHERVAHQRLRARLPS